jgi:hypothetical protein
MESRKQAVSIRMSSADVRKIKRLAERLGVRDSDIIRFAVKSMLGKLAPLHDPMIRGRGLVPVFLDYGQELAHQFDLDAARLEAIINQDADEKSSVEREDIQLLALNGFGRPYPRWYVDPRAAVRPHGPNGVEGSRVADRQPGSANGKERHHELDEDGKSVSMRAYLFEKYLYGDGGPV